MKFEIVIKNGDIIVIESEWVISVTGSRVNSKITVKNYV